MPPTPREIKEYYDIPSLDSLEEDILSLQSTVADTQQAPKLERLIRSYRGAEQLIERIQAVACREDMSDTTATYTISRMIHAYSRKG